jgi:hypothetical protein
LKLLITGILSAGAALCQSSGETTVPVAVTPEPATFGLMALGLGAVGFSAWRQKKKREKAS